MRATYRNRLVTAISNTPGTSGALTIASAASGYRTFTAADDGLSFDVSIVDGTAWEIRTGCVYTHSGTSLSRGTLEDSSTGSAINLTSAAVVTVTMSAGMGNGISRLLDTGFVFVQNDNSATQSLAASTATKIAAALAVEVSDTNGWWDHANKKFQPTRAGKYMITASIGISSVAASKEALIDLYKNGAAFVRLCRLATAAPTNWPCLSGSAVVALNGSTDYIEVFALHLDSVSRSTEAASVSNWFQAVFIGD